MKLFSHHLWYCIGSIIILAGSAKGQVYVDLIDLTFSPSNAGDVASHPDVSNITPWVNGSETLPDPFGSGLNYMPDNDFGAGYAGLTVPSPNFGYKWGFEGSFDLASSNLWEVGEISFDYNVLGHNGEANLALMVGSWSANAPLPSTGPQDFGPIFSEPAVGEQASGKVTFNFQTDTLTVTRDGYGDYTTTFTDTLSLGTGTHGIDMLVTNTASSEGGWDANAGSTDGIQAFYQIDNFRINATQIPEPSALFLSLIGATFCLTVRRRQR